MNVWQRHNSTDCTAAFTLALSVSEMPPTLDKVSIPRLPILLLSSMCTEYPLPDWSPCGPPLTWYQVHFGFPGARRIKIKC